MTLAALVVVVGCRSPFEQGGLDAQHDIGKGHLEYRIRHGDDSRSQRILSRVWQERFNLQTTSVGCPRNKDAQRVAGYNAAVSAELSRRFGTNWLLTTAIEAELERRKLDYSPNEFE